MFVNHSNSSSAQALDGIRVIDLTHYVAGPFCTKLLADHGADVIKVERPGAGDGGRSLAPFSNNVPGLEASGLFQYLNTSKRGITLNLDTATGRRIFLELLSTAQVVVESFSPRVMAGLGLGFDVLHQAYPPLVMTSISNFGQTGPYRDYKATEMMEYAMGGPMYVTGNAAREPIKIGDGIVQHQAGAAAALATMIALYDSEMTGVGDHVDLSVMEVQAGNIDRRTLNLLSYQYTGDVCRRFPTKDRLASGTFPCRDGYVEFDASTPAALANIPEIIGRPELASDPRFADSRARYLPENIQMINSLVLQWITEHDRAEVLSRAQAGRVMAGSVNTSADLLRDPQFKVREFWMQVESQGPGAATFPGSPLTWSESPGIVCRPAPSLGQHNQEILCGELGYSREEVDKLKEAGAI